MVTELGKTLSDGQSMQKYELKTEGMEGFEEKVTIKQNLCDQSSQVKSQVRQQLSSSFEFPTVTSLSLLDCLLVLVSAAGLTCLLPLPSTHRDRESKVTQMERSREIPEIP